MPPIKRIRSTKKISKSNPILKHKLQNKKSTVSHKLQKMKTTTLTLQQIMQEMKIYKNFYKDGISVKTALSHSLKIDVERARTQLRAVYITNVHTGIFKFRVKSSGLYDKDSYEVHLSWDISKMSKEQDVSKLFWNAPIKFQCTCERHTYWYRYLWTVVGGSIGLQETRYPKVRNKMLKGMLCKHGIKVMETIKRTPFQKTFERYINNQKDNKQTRVTASDKASIAGSSFGVNKKS